jgi:CheY-like chemotaxis protein
VSVPDPIRILAVDDHPLVRGGIAALIANQPDMSLIAEEGSNGREAIQEFRTHQPDITLMDLQMPEMSGLDAIIAIRAEFTNARIIVLTTYAGDVQALRALQAGAHAYMLKIAALRLHSIVHTFSVLVIFAAQSAGCECRGRLGTARVSQVGGARGERRGAIQIPHLTGGVFRHTDEYQRGGNRTPYDFHRCLLEGRASHSRSGTIQATARWQKMVAG